MTSPAAPPAPRAVPTRPIGTAGPTAFWANVQQEETPELRWPLSVKVYDRMRRQDGQVGSTLEALTQPIMATRWSINPAGARDEVVELLAEDLGLPVLGQDDDQQRRRRRQRGRFQWAQHLQEALLMLPFGHSYFEQEYRIEVVNGRPMARLRKLGPRMPWTLSAIDVAEDGGLAGIRQHSAKDPIGVERLVAYVNRREGGNWYGQSVLRTAYKHWILKDRLLRRLDEVTDRNGMGVPVYEGGPNERDLTGGEKLAQSVRSGDTAGAATPYGSKLRLMGVDGQLPDLMGPIRYHDEQIARSVLAHVLNLGQQANAGSWALGTTLMDFLAMRLNASAYYLRDTANAHVVEDWVDLNFGEDEPTPLIHCEDIGAKDAALLAALVQLIGADAITVDPRLEEHVRQRLDLPSRDPAAPPAPAPVPVPVPDGGGAAGGDA